MRAGLVLSDPVLGGKDGWKGFLAACPSAKQSYQIGPIALRRPADRLHWAAGIVHDYPRMPDLSTGG